MVKLGYLLFVFSLMLHFSFVQAQIVISEVMFDVVGPDYHDEFVELYNCSSEAVDLKGWQISDSSESDLILGTGNGTVLQPEQFAVILDGSYFGNSTVYDSIIPPQALILAIDDGAFGSNGFSNSVAERIMLFDSSGIIVDSYKYSLDNEPGYSDEKINLCQPNEKANWANALILGGTPGFRNSVSPFDFDIGFTENGLSFKPQSIIKKGQNVQVQLQYQNVGTQTFSATIVLRCFLDLNNNRQWEVLEPLLLDQQKEVNLVKGEVDSLIFKTTINWSGQLSIVAQIQSNMDQNSLNNTIQKSLTVMENKVPLAINEIKFLTEDGEPEWVELYNYSAQAIPLKNWAIADSRDTLWIKDDFVLPAFSYFVLTADSSFFDYYEVDDSVVYITKDFPALNNDQDVLFLIAPWGNWLEQVPYTKDWLLGEDFRKPSLERINPQLDARLARNWAPCVKTGTPATKNSVFTEIKYSHFKMNAQPNPFSPDGDGHQDFTVISLTIPAQTARLRLLIFDVLGRQICTLSEDKFVGQDVQMVWDGRDAHKKRVRMGLYILFAQMIDDTNGILQEAKATVVVAY